MALYRQYQASALMLRHGLSPVERGTGATLARALGVSRSTISRDFRKMLDEFGSDVEMEPDKITAAQSHAIKAIEEASQGVQTPLALVEHALLRPTSFLIVPLFALANAGVDLRGGGICTRRSKRTRAEQENSLLEQLGPEPSCAERTTLLINETEHDLEHAANAARRGFEHDRRSVRAAGPRGSRRGRRDAVTLALHESDQPCTADHVTAEAACEPPRVGNEKIREVLCAAFAERSRVVAHQRLDRVAIVIAQGWRRLSAGARDGGAQ